MWADWGSHAIRTPGSIRTMPRSTIGGPARRRHHHAAVRRGLRRVRMREQCVPEPRERKVADHRRLHHGHQLASLGAGHGEAGDALAPTASRRPLPSLHVRDGAALISTLRSARGLHRHRDPDALPRLRRRGLAWARLAPAPGKSRWSCHCSGPAEDGTPAGWYAPHGRGSRSPALTWSGARSGSHATRRRTAAGTSSSRITNSGRASGSPRPSRARRVTRQDALDLRGHRRDGFPGTGAWGRERATLPRQTCAGAHCRVRLARRLHSDMTRRREP